MILFLSENITPQNAVLEADEFHHCCKVLRHKVGDEIPICDGKGKKATAIITRIKKRTAELEVSSHTIAPPKMTSCTLAVAPPKNRARWELILEKAVEIGVDHIIPLMTARSERARINVERSSKIIRSAALQSLRDYHPTFAKTTSFTALLKGLPSETDLYVAHYDQANEMLPLTAKSYSSGYIMIGPEGDFTEVELDAARALNIKEVNISHHRLRTETAAIVSVNLLKSMGY